MLMSMFILKNSPWIFIKNCGIKIFHFLWIELGESSKKICSFMIKIYQCTLSPYFSGRCRFYPSCSEYALQAFREKPFGKALFLLFQRLLKCHPFYFNSSVWDPLPKMDNKNVIKSRKERSSV